MSHNPSRPSLAKRFRQRITVFRLTDNRFAMVTSESPAAAAKTIRQRKATCCGVPYAAVHCSSFSRSRAASSHDFPMPQHKPITYGLSSYLLDNTLATWPVSHSIVLRVSRQALESGFHWSRSQSGRALVTSGTSRVAPSRFPEALLLWLWQWCWAAVDRQGRVLAE